MIIKIGSYFWYIVLVTRMNVFFYGPLKQFHKKNVFGINVGIA